MNELLTCPRCSRKDITVLPDNDGDPYLCDTCWNDDGGETCETCGDLIAGGSPFSRFCDKCLDARPLTNGTATPENYYRIKFANVAYDVFEYGETAKAAIWNALDDLLDAGHAEPLGNATARQAVYKEWNYGTDRYTNGGGFIANPRTVN
jgi:hypothetical protein